MNPHPFQIDPERKNGRNPGGRGAYSFHVIVAGNEEYTPASRGAKRLASQRSGAQSGMHDSFDSLRRDARMKAALVPPVLTHQMSELVYAAVLQRISHHRRQRLHPRQRRRHAGLARTEGVDHGRDRLSGDARLAGIDDHEPTLQRLHGLLCERDAPPFDGCTEGKRQRASQGGSVVVLTSARHAELLHLHLAAPLRQLSSREPFTAQFRQRGGQGHARGGRSTKPRAGREIAGHHQLDAANSCMAEGRLCHQGPSRRVEILARPSRAPILDDRRGTGPTSQRDGGVPVDRHVAYEAALGLRVWRHVGPPSAQVNPRRRARFDAHFAPACVA